MTGLGNSPRFARLVTPRAHTVLAASVACAVSVALAGCQIEGRSARAQQLLSDLSPLRLTQTVEQARAAVPSLRVHHLGERWSTRFHPDPVRPFLAGVIANPSPAAGDSASPDADVEGVEFLLTVAQANEIRARTTALLGQPTSVACAGASISETDSVVDWARDVRGGVLLTFPQRRVDGEPSVARLFFYSSGWNPRRAISGYGVMQCDE